MRNCSIPSNRSEHLAQDWLSRGVRLVIVTKGGEGAVAFTAHGCSAAVPGVHVDVVDTVGAGDTFQAATLVWLEKHDALQAAAAADLDSDALRSLLSFGARRPPSPAAVAAPICPLRPNSRISR